MDIDELVKKTAAERGVTPLAESLGVKLADAEDVISNVVREGFFDEMQRYGFVPRTKEAADQMIKVASRLEEQLMSEDADPQNDHVGNLFKTAAQVLDQQLGNGKGEAAYASQAALQNSLAKTAGYAENPKVAALLLARHDAYSILQGDE